MGRDKGGRIIKLDFLGDMFPIRGGGAKKRRKNIK